MDLADALAVQAQRNRIAAQLAVGTVVGVPSTGLTVSVDLGNSDLGAEGEVFPTVPRLRSYSPIVGDIVLVVRSGGSLYCVGALNAPPAAPPEPKPKPKPPPPKPVTRTRSFRPIQTGSYRNGSWRGDTSDLYQSDWTGRGPNFGGAHYGNGPAALRGTAVRGRVHLRRIGGAGRAAPVPPRMRLLSQRREGGAPNEIDAVMGPALSFGQSRTWTMPTSWAAALIAGSAGGIGIGSGGEYMGLMGPARWSPSMVLEITYRS